MTEQSCGIRPTVLLSLPQGDARTAPLCSYLHAQGIACKGVPPAAYDKPIGAVLELPGFIGADVPLPGPAFAEPMLVMFGFHGDMLSKLLQFIRDTGLPPIALKAMVTPTNVAWSSRQLHAELQKEHAGFAKQKSAPAGK